MVIVSSLRQDAETRSTLTDPASLPLLLGVVFATLVCAILAGCGYSGSAIGPAVALGGSVHGGDQPINGASIQLYAAGSKGNGSAAQPLLSESILSDSNGNFTIPATYGCPAATSLIFIVARGGSPGMAAGSANPALGLTAMLGPCGTLSSLGPISINEVTTVGSVWPLAPFMKSSTDLGATAADPAFTAAVASIFEFINIAQGSSPGTPTTTSYFAQNAKLDSLANLLADCVNSTGGTAGDGSACGRLFSLATPTGGSAPTDTMSAAMNIAQNPSRNVAGIFGMVSSDTPFQPMVTSAPADWTLTLAYLVATPSISLATGTYSGAQYVTISDSTPDSSIYYTTDGTLPTSASNLYSGPILISASATLQAAAFLQGSASAIAASTFTISSPRPPATLAFLQQPSNAVAGANVSPAVQVVVEDGIGNAIADANNPITLALVGGSGLTGMLTTVPQNGVATFNNLSVSVPGSYTLSATSPGLVSAASISFTISAPTVLNPGPAAAKLAFLQQPSDAVTYATIAPAVQVVVEDGNGNTLTTASDPVTLLLVSSSGIGSTLWTTTPQNGVATFSNLTVSNAGAGYTLVASSPGRAAAVSTAFTVTAPSTQTSPVPSQLSFLQQPSNALTGATISPAVQVVVEDSNGMAVTNANSRVTLTLAGGSGLGGTLTITPQNGVATFGNLSVSNAGSGYTLTASSPGLTSATSSSFTINPPSRGAAPVKLAFSQQPSSALTGATIAPAVTVTVEDSNGNPVPTAAAPITLTLSGNASLAGTLTVTPQNGVASFSNLSVGTAGAGYTLSAASPNLASATSTRFTISSPGTSPTPAKLAFMQQPSNALTGATIGTVTVTIEDSNGVTVSGATNAVTLALPGGGLNGTLTVPAQNGLATFSNLNVSYAGTYTLSSTSTGLASAASASFAISVPVVPPSAVKLGFLQQPSDAMAGATISPAVKVVIEDATGNAVAAATNPVTLVLSIGTGLGGALTAVPQNGVATFANLSENAAGTYSLLATSPGLVTASSAGFTISAPVVTPTAAKLVFAQQPSNALTGATLMPAVTVLVEDSSGNVFTSAVNPVTLALTSGSGLGGTLTVTPQNGVATFSNLTESTVGSYTLTATSPGLTSAQSAGFTITAPVVTPTPSKLVFVQQPSNALTGVTITPAVTIAVEDNGGNTVSNATNPVTVALTNGSGLSGTLTALPQNGIVTFSNLTESTVGSYTLTAASTSLTSALSASFTITAPVVTPTAAKLAFAQQPSNALSGAAITPAVTVRVEDSSGNIFTSATNPVTLALTSGSGLGGTLTVTPQNGIATFSNLTESTVGNYALAATSAGLTSALSAGFTIAAPVVTPTAAKLVFGQQPGNALTGATITPAVTVLVEDSSGNTVLGATNPVTIALTSGSGLAGTLTLTPQNGIASFSNLSESVGGTYTLSATSLGLTSATSSTFTINATANCSITSFGAVADGVTNNATAIQNTFNYAATHNCAALIPAGTFAYSGVLVARGIAVMGTGAASILKAQDTNNEALSLTGNGGSISNLVMLGTGTVRTFTYQAAMIWVNGASNFIVENVLIDGGSCVGIYDSAGQSGLIQNNTVENTLADSITNTDGAHTITVKGNRVINSGDDGVSNNSYLTDATTVHDITVEGNTILHNAWGRGLEVSGGNNITFQGNYVDNLDGYTDMYIASEQEYKTQNVSNITVSGNTFVDGGPNQGSAIIYNSEAGATTITGVTFNGNQFVNPKIGAVQLAGNGSETGIVINNNTDYSTIPFSFSSNSNASASMIGNQVLVPSSFTTPLVPPGGGCAFSGC